MNKPWPEMCRIARFRESMAMKLCSEDAAKAIHEATEEFVSQPAPENDGELRRRSEAKRVLFELVNAIVRDDKAARSKFAQR